MAIEGVSISSYKHSVTDNGNGTSTVKYNLNEHWVYKDGAFTDEQPLTKSGTKTGTGMYAQGVTVSDYYLKNGRSYSADSGTTIDKMFLVSSLVNDYITKYTISSSCIVSDIITTHSNAYLEMQVMITFYDSSGKSISTLRGYSGEINAFSGSKTLTATKEITIPSNAYYFQPCVSVFFYPKVDGATTVADTFTYMGGDFLIETVQPTSSLPEDTPEQPTTPTRKFTRLYIGGAVASSGTRVFKKLTTEEPLPAGLYDANDNLVASWDALVNSYGVDVAKDYESSKYKTDESSIYYVLTNNSELSTGVKLVIGGGVLRIGEMAISQTNLTIVTIYDGVTEIGNNAFYNCNKLTSVTIPNSVTYIGGSAFFYCTRLTGIWVGKSNTAYSSDGNGVLFNKEKTELIKAPGRLNGAYAIPEGVTRIAAQSFFMCANLTSVTIPNSVTYMGGAFSMCTNLTSVVIPDGVTGIKASTFSGCTNLTSVVIPDGVTSIALQAFYRTNLKNVYYRGSQTKWGAIYIESGNEALKNATIHYNYTG